MKVENFGADNFLTPVPLIKINVYMISELSSCALCIVHVIEHLNNL